MNIKGEIEKYLRLGELKDTFIQLIEAKFELKKLEVQEQIERLVVELIFALVAAFFVLIIAILLSVLAGEGLNQLLHSSWLGYATMCCIYLVSLIFWLSQRITVKRVIKRKVEKIVDEKVSDISIIKEKTNLTIHKNN